MPSIAIRATALVAAALATTAHAGVIPFTGTQRNQDQPGTAPFRCAPGITVNIRPTPFFAEGTSNLGGFTVNQSHCLAAPPPGAFFDGLFTWTFDSGDAISGTYGGTLAATDTPGVFSIAGNYSITGGAGRFRHATGAFTTEGTLIRAGGPPTAEQRFEGFIDTPQPAMASLFWLGVAGMIAARRKRG